MRQKPLILETDALTKSQDSATNSQLGTSNRHKRKASLMSMFSDPSAGSTRQTKSGGLRNFARSLWTDVYGTTGVPTSTASRSRSSSRSRSRSRHRADQAPESASEDIDVEEGYDVQKLKEILWENLYAGNKSNDQAPTVVSHHKHHHSSFPRKHGYQESHSNSNVAGEISSMKGLGTQLPNLQLQNMVQWTTKGIQNCSISSNRRILVLQGIPPNTTPSAVLAQICCGPLERLVWKHNSYMATLEVYFVFAEHANRFREYCTATGFFVVNGVKLRVEWANRSNTEHINHEDSHAPVPKNLLNEIVHGSARRVLICSKPIPNKVPNMSSPMHYPQPQLHLSKDFDLDLIRRDFSQYGEIVDFGAVVSKKLCFSIHFADVRSAIVAKNDLQTDGGMMAMKYSDWSFWYGKDPTDKPCYVL